MRKPNPNARKLRKSMPPAEALLWSCLRRKQLAGFRFRRQHSIGSHIIDFICLYVKLIVELDGSQHGEALAQVADARRDAFLESEGFVVLRFWNAAVFDETDAVLSKICSIAEDLARETRI
ncbi:MAG: DUF559 domain-containing protein [Aquisalinus sp.]|nr:DUF559 domain-containing protein [Aquisalinus sp.]